MEEAGRGRSPASQDGRVLRGERNHAIIVQAVYDLVREHHLPPSIEEVAARAGVGTRTVFRQFEDVEGLYRSINARVLGEVMALFTPVAPTGVLAEDLSALVSLRARIYEHITPFRRAGRFVRHRSAFLQDEDARATRLFRGGLEGVVKPHLRDDAKHTLEALDVLLSFEAWDRLRDTQKLGVKRAQQVLLGAALALVRASSAAPAGVDRG